MNQQEPRREPLYQVWATETKTGKLVPVPYFPRAMKPVAEEWVSLMKQAIASGKYTAYSDPKALLHLATLN